MSTTHTDPASPNDHDNSMSLAKRIAAVRTIRERLQAQLSAARSSTPSDEADVLVRVIRQTDSMLDACPVGGALHAYLREVRS